MTFEEELANELLLLEREKENGNTALRYAQESIAASLMGKYGEEMKRVLNEPVQVKKKRTVKTIIDRIFGNGKGK